MNWWNLAVGKTTGNSIRNSSYHQKFNSGSNKNFKSNLVPHELRSNIFKNSTIKNNKGIKPKKKKKKEKNFSLKNKKKN